MVGVALVTVNPLVAPDGPPVKAPGTLTVPATAFPFVIVIAEPLALILARLILPIPDPFKLPIVFELLLTGNDNKR